MEFRYEMIRELNHSDAVTLEHRLMVVAAPSVYKNREFNSLHNLYFSSDKPEEAVIFLLCYYNDGIDGIRLVKLNRQRDMACSEYCEVTREFVNNVLQGNFSSIVTDPMGKSGTELDPLIQEFYWLVIGNGLRPKYTIDFERKSFSYGQGNVQINIDSNRRISFDVKDYLNPEHSSTLLSDDKVVKVEWESYLPDIVKSAIDIIDYRTQSYTSIVAPVSKALFV